MVSIIIPCYNIAQHLPTCIQSVLLQTFTDFELLLINDGSTDTTLQICEQFAANDSRIKVFTHQNKGVSYTRNRGIKEAKGEYIMFVDGDDYVERDYIEKHLIDLVLYQALVSFLQLLNLYYMKVLKVQDFSLLL